MNDNFLTEKVLTGENVLRAAIARIEWIFETFPSVCLSFSGGKDSTVLFHLVADV
ncbi:phosphoadenosine phosphosulfate reductase, partial [Escherichia coli]